MNRYPGIRPFRTDERHLFFGRADDTERLYRLLRLEQLVVLYGKSGYGKSSLLRAGIYPRLEEEGRYRHWEIRLGPYKAGESASPAIAVTAAIALAGASSIWRAIKSRQTPDAKRFVLFFDQFEELFTYPPDQIAEFNQQLAEALFSAMPPAFASAVVKTSTFVKTSADELADEKASAGKAEEALLYQPFDLKVLFSIRADRMSLLNQLKDYLPNLLQHNYQLDALDEKQATDAVVQPAGLTNSQFDTPPFDYSPQALRLIFNELRDPDTGRIETSALQIVCKHVEDNIVARYTADGTRYTAAQQPIPQITKSPNKQITNTPITIGAADLGDLKTVFRAFYDNTIAALDEAEREPARRLVEDRLIKDGIRLPYAEAALLTEPGITPALLSQLERASLLRVELDDQRRKIYEIGHDTLVAPISEAANARRDAEEKERLRREADEQRREKETAIAARRRARLIAAGAILLALFAIAASIFAWQKMKIADAATAKATLKQVEADSSARKADREAANARIQQDSAFMAKTEAQIQAGRAIAAQQKAADALDRANGNASIAVKVLLLQASTAVRKINYPDALASLDAAAKLGQQREAVGKGLLEIAYFYNESEKDTLARNIARDLSAFLGKKDLTTFQKLSNLSTLQNLRDALKSLDPAHFDSMERRYYPLMLPILAGTFLMGRDTLREPEGGGDELPRHPVQLSAYALAHTETTFWQWNLYCTAKGLKTQDFSPSWGIDGDNPAVNMTWFQCLEYLNWLSERQGLQPVYKLSNPQPGNFRTVYDVDIDSLATGYRLPTEAEWECAAHGGVSAMRADTYPKYAGSDSLDLVGWYDGNSTTKEGVRRTHPVAQKMKNQAGFYDLSGNVWEWCQDWYGERHYEEFGNSAAKNPSGPGPGDESRRVLRGGSWDYLDIYCRSAFRFRVNPVVRIDYYGFRAARH